MSLTAAGVFLFLGAMGATLAFIVAALMFAAKASDHESEVWAQYERYLEAIAELDRIQREVLDHPTDEEVAARVERERRIYQEMTGHQVYDRMMRDLEKYLADHRSEDEQ